MKEDDAKHADRTFSGTLMRVLLIQVISLVLLWVLQARYSVL